MGTGSTLQFSGGTRTLNAGASVSGAGSVVFSGGTITLNDAYNVGGTTTFNGATVDVNGTYASGGGLTLSAGSVSFDTPAATLTFPGMTVSGGTLTGTDNFVVSGPFNWTNGTITGAGTADHECGGGDGAGHGLGRGGAGARVGQLRHGELELERQRVPPERGRGGVHEQGGCGVRRAGDQRCGRYRRAGRLRTRGCSPRPATTTATIGVPFSNTGSVAVSGGTLTVSAFPTNDGTITVKGTGAANTLNVNGNLTLQPSRASSTPSWGAPPRDSSARSM